MKPAYERIKFKITEFDSEDVITTSGLLPTDPTNPDGPSLSASEKENIIGGYSEYNQLPGSWF
ncbi:hypothetical protein SAMN02910436_02572 [Ruminococcaceae bacterium P7]|nr:hypothetical protein SAMN02910436_02572 [Ruminococcaceae bacterium P7]